MTLLIKIPKEFEQHFKDDRFEDSLYRLSTDAHLLAGNYEQETAMMLVESFKNAIPVPSHGRLIDADELIELCNIMADKCGDVSESIWNQFRETVEWVPIIIPAEEDE